MKIAVASEDGVSVSQHFGRSAGFVVFDANDGQISTGEFRTNRQTPHAQGLCGIGEHTPGHGHGHEHAQGHSGHSHAGIVDLLQDCQVVLCGGMGAGAAQALTARGIRPVVTSAVCPASEAVAQYVKGELNLNTSGFCGCK